MKLIETLKNQWRIYMGVSSKFSRCKVDSRNNIKDTYMNYLNKTAGTPKQQWNRILTVIKYPTVLIPVFIGFGSIIIVLCYDNIITKTFFTALSSIGFGVGINYFTFYLKENDEFKLLNYKGEYTIRILNSKIEKILSKQTLTQDDKNEITDFLNLINQWKDYVDYADTSTISYHKRLQLEIEQESDKQKKEFLEIRKSSLEHNWVKNGLGSFVTISGSPGYDSYTFMK